MARIALPKLSTVGWAELAYQAAAVPCQSKRKDVASQLVQEYPSLCYCQKVQPCASTAAHLTSRSGDSPRWERATSKTAATPAVPPEGHTVTGTAPSSQHRPHQLKSIMEALLHTPTLVLGKRSLVAPSLQDPPTDHHQGPSSAFPLPGQAKPPHSSPYTTDSRSWMSGEVQNKAAFLDVASQARLKAKPTGHALAHAAQHGPLLASTGEPFSWLRLPVLQSGQDLSSSPRHGAGASQPQLSCSPSLQESRPCSSPTTTSPFSATANCDSEEESLSEVFLLCQLSNAQEEPLAAPHQELEIGLFYNSCLKVTCINFVQFKAFCPGLCIQPYSPY